MTKTNKITISFFAMGLIAVVGINAVDALNSINYSTSDNSFLYTQSQNQKQDIINELNTLNSSSRASRPDNNRNTHSFYKNITDFNFHSSASYFKAISSGEFITSEKLALELGYRFGMHNSNSNNRPKNIISWTPHNGPMGNWIEPPPKKN